MPRARAALSLPAGLLLALLALACKPEPRVAIIGEWKLIPASTSAGQMDGMKVKINEDGTFAISGDRMFQTYANNVKITGVYDWVDELAIKVSLDDRAYDYRNEVMKIQIISRNELIISSRDRDEIFTLARK